MNYPSLQLYSGIVVGSSLLDVGLRWYRSRTHIHKNPTKVGLAVASTMQNLSFLIPVAWAGYRSWQAIVNPVGGPVDKILATIAVAIPFGSASFIAAGFGLNPLFALGAPRAPKDLTAHFTPLICNLFRVLNVAATSLLFTAGKISLSSTLLTTSACLTAMVAQNSFSEAIH